MSLTDINHLVFLINHVVNAEKGSNQSNRKIKPVTEKSLQTFLNLVNVSVVCLFCLKRKHTVSPFGISISNLNLISLFHRATVGKSSQLTLGHIRTL